VSLSLAPIWLLRGIIAVCALNGFLRGIGREAGTFAGVLIGPMVAPLLAGLFASVSGATASRGAGHAATRVTAQNLVGPEVMAFLAVVAAGFLLGLIVARGPRGLLPRLLGAILGGVNGYLIVQYLFPKLLPASEVAAVGLAEPAGSGPVSNSAGLLLIGVVMVISGLGVWAASGKPKAGR
jgi:uncharacterized membrane protein required for colicin V production